MIIGSHASYAKEGLLGSVKASISYGSNTFMFYTGAPQNTIRKEIDQNLTNEAHKLMKENNMELKHVICHAPYIINLATNKEINWNFSISFVKQEMARCKLLGVDKLVIHPGNAVGITKEEGLENVIKAFKLLANDDITLLIETMAGKGTEVCSNMDELVQVLESVNHPNIGVCLDTCHLNDSGVDIKKFSEYLDEFDKRIGIKKLGCIHLNDSKNELGQKKDRHANIGYGTIGFDTLVNICYIEKLKDVPKILETPFVAYENTSFPPFKFEIEMIKTKTFNPNLIEDIISYYK